ncbi:aldehyde dehydrogenase family protein [Halomonas sp. HMF6819]|uniref:aldehyde dehydrogenase family protein n=1 Tax=Halomonas sp. HMF6819 TaxID=3373085 RepID=UPI0037B4B174
MTDIKRYQLRIGDQWCDAADGNMLASINPANQQVWAMIAQAAASDVNAAVTAARHAFETDWRSTNGLKRAALMHQLANR